MIERESHDTEIRMQKELIEKGFKELLQDEMVIYAVLKKLNITKGHPNYDDFISEARLLYLKAYEKNDKSGRQRFNYFFTKIYWGLLDILRKERRLNEANIRPQPDDEDSDIEFEMIDTHVDLEAQLEFSELLAAIHQKCTEKEWFYITQRLQGKTIKEIAEIYQVHPSAVYQWKAALKKKIQCLFEKI